MERRVANPYPGPPPPVPYYHNNYNHHPPPPPPHQMQPPPPPQPHHHHVSAVGFHSYGQNDNRDQRFNQPHYNHYPVPQQNMIGDHKGPFPGVGFSPSGGGRKRGPPSATGLSPDPTDGGGRVAKLYIAPVTKTANEDEVRQVFAKYGDVTEIILPKDKKSGERTAYCFVKYKTFEEGDAAIAALQDQYTFPGETAPVKVRYADAERERLAQIPDKLYVRFLSKHTTKMEMQEVFARYGTIEDIYMAVDDMKLSRGYAFVQFSRREMALAAIKGLNGVFTMRGSDQPLTVKFADPKKPRLGEARPTFNGPPPVQQFDPNWHPPPYPQWGNAPPRVVQHHDFPSQPSNFPQQNSQAVPEVHRPMHPDIPPQKCENQQKPEAASVETNTSESQKISSTFREDSKTTSPECDWSEHICPDGNKYYFHCITGKSTWEKPEEYSLFERWFEEQTRSRESKPVSPQSQAQAENSEQPQAQADLSQQTTRPQQPSLSIVDDEENNLVHPVTRQAVEPTCS